MEPKEFKYSQGCSKGDSRLIYECLKSTRKIVSEMLQSFFSQVFQHFSKIVSMLFQGVKWVFLGGFKGFCMFQDSFKDVSSVFRGCPNVF